MSVCLDQVYDKHVVTGVNICLSFLWCLSQTATGMKYAEDFVRWEKLVRYLNGIAQFPFEVKLVEGDQMPSSNEIGWIPEDILIRGQIWVNRFIRLVSSEIAQRKKMNSTYLGQLWRNPEDADVSG
ncbi:hypothetical protein BDW75DRAFT_244248 [Aspergillus navahoensis]